MFQQAGVGDFAPPSSEKHDTHACVRRGPLKNSDRVMHCQ